MRRLVTAASAALMLPLLSLAPAHAADLEYVALNEKGMKQILLKKSWMPAWFGPVELYDASSQSKGETPTDCRSRKDPVTGPKSKQSSLMIAAFEQNKADHSLSVNQSVFQYADVSSAERAWQQWQGILSGCAGTFTHVIRDDDGRKIANTTVTITVTTATGMYGQQQVLVNQDVLLTPIDSKNPSVASADVLSVWMYDGMAIVNVSAFKLVPKQKGWVFSPPQISTVETLALVAIQRYHLAALRAL